MKQSVVIDSYNQIHVKTYSNLQLSEVQSLPYVFFLMPFSF